MPRALYYQDGYGQIVCIAARRQSAEIYSAVVCTGLYVHFVRTFSTDVAAALKRRNALGKPSFGFPRPFPRLEATQKKFQGFEFNLLSLTTFFAVTRSFTFWFSGTVGREGWALCIYFNLGVHFINGCPII